MNNNNLFRKIRTLIAILIALFLGFVIIALVSESPWDTLVTFLLGPLRSTRYMGNVVERMIPLIFAGLATAILFQANLFNLGAEGIFYISGLTAAFVAVKFSFNSPLPHILFALCASTLVGVIVGLVPGFLKAKWDANELVSSLMINSILAGVGLYFLNNQIRDENLTEIASYKFSVSALLPKIIPSTRVHAGLIICLVVTALVIALFRTHRLGYLLKLFGLNKSYIEYSGYSSFRMIILAHLLAGAIAGLGGGVEILGMHDRFRWAALPGLGFDGALVAMLAQNNPVSVLGASLFLAYIRTGADIMARQADVPAEMVSLLQAIIILLVSADRFLHSAEQRQLLKKALATDVH
ncbi:MAG: ABC transporter permease [Spirochaetales bacterium]|nr:MAG: ABC transporter permease [Spirochaetales bacterium]